MTLGVVPRWAETGYGYLELGEPGRGRRQGVRAGAALRREARRRRTPRASCASGDYLWNAGIFVFRGTTLLDVVARLAAGAGARAGGDRRRAATACASSTPASPPTRSTTR